MLVVERSPASGTEVVYQLRLNTGAVTTFTTTPTAGSNGPFFDVSFLADGRALLSQETIGPNVPLVVLNTLTGSFSTTTQTIGTRATLTASASQETVLVQPIASTYPLYLYSVAGGVVAQVNGIADPFAGAALPPPSRGIQAISPAGTLIAQGLTQNIYNGSLTAQLSLNTDYSYLSAQSLAFSPDGSRLYLLLGGTDAHVVAFDAATYDVLAYYPVGATAASAGSSQTPGYGDILQASADGRYLTVLGTNGVQVIDLTLVVSESGPGDDTLSGGPALYGFGGNDTLTGDATTTLLVGGRGDDLYFVNSNGTLVTEAAGQGNDTVRSTITYTLGANIERLILDGSAAINGTGNAQDNEITGNNANNVLIGGGGSDVIVGGGGNDDLYSDGNDTLIGGTGDDVYVVVGTGNTLVENLGEGFDTISTQVSYVLPDNFEGLSLTSNDPVNGTGNALDNTLTGNFGNNILRGGDGNDLINGNAGADTLFGDAGNDRLNGGADNDQLYGGDGNDILNGDAGDDLLDGGIGADSLSGGTGNDVYVVDNAGDTVTELTSEGNDRVLTTVSYRLSATADIELLSAANQLGTQALDLGGSSIGQVIIGNDGINNIDGLGGNDTLYGLGGDDVLDGGTGNDQLYGGLGNDWFIVDSASDAVYENAGQGYDRVLATASYQLAANAEIELLATLAQTGTGAIDLTGNGFAQTVIGNDGVNSLNGGGGNDTLYGLGGDDVLDGGTGADQLVGGLGNDSYAVDDASDAVYENAGEGYDRVLATASFRLGSSAEVELLSAANQSGTGALDLAGNGTAQTVIGNEGTNSLEGLGGNDTLYGLGGNDYLDGGTGADQLIGGTGNDWYFVDDANDIVIENAGEGSDRVLTTLSYALSASAEVELLSAADQNGTTAIDLSGSSSGQSIIGNEGTNRIDGLAGNDTLFGLGGNDVLDGGLGFDYLVGGAGADTFAFSTALGGDNFDRITDFVSGSDRIQLSQSVFAALGLGGIAAGQFVAGTAALDADDRILYDQATGTIFYDADGNGSGAAVAFAQLNAGTTLVASDFIVV